MPVLEQRGVGSYHELSLISDQEYSKVTRTGMTKDEIARLRTVLAQADTIVGSAGSGAGKPPVLKAAVASSSSLEEKQEQGLVGDFTQRLSFLGTFAEGLATSALQEVFVIDLDASCHQFGNAFQRSIFQRDNIIIVSCLLFRKSFLCTQSASLYVFCFFAWVNR